MRPENCTGIFRHTHLDEDRETELVTNTDSMGDITRNPHIGVIGALAKILTCARHVQLSLV